MARSERGHRVQQGLGFDYDEGHGEQGLTALAGMPVLLQAFRSLDLPRSVRRNVSLKQRQRGLDEAGYVESFLILNAAGGECLDDFAHLRQDGVQELIGHDLPSPESARRFLNQFHDDSLIESRKRSPPSTRPFRFLAAAKPAPLSVANRILPANPLPANH